MVKHILLEPFFASLQIITQATPVSDQVILLLDRLHPFPYFLKKSSSGQDELVSSLQFKIDGVVVVIIGNVINHVIFILYIDVRRYTPYDNIVNKL